MHAAPGGHLHGLFMHGIFHVGLPATRALLSRPTAFWPEILSRDYVESALRAGPDADPEQQGVLIAAAGMELWRRAVDAR